MGAAWRPLAHLFSHDLLDRLYSFVLFRTKALLQLKWVLHLLLCVYFREAVFMYHPTGVGVRPSCIHSVTGQVVFECLICARHYYGLWGMQPLIETRSLTLLSLWSSNSEAGPSGLIVVRRKIKQVLEQSDRDEECLLIGQGRSL